MRGHAIQQAVEETCPNEVQIVIGLVVFMYKCEIIETGAREFEFSPHIHKIVAQRPLLKVLSIYMRKKYESLVPGAFSSARLCS